MGRIKVLFRAMKIAKPNAAKNFIARQFEDLTVFAKEVCLLMEALNDQTLGCFKELEYDLVNAILKPPASSVQVIRTWLLEIFVRGIVDLSSPNLKKLEALGSASDKRQILLIRGRCEDKNFFRKNKTAIQNFSDLEIPCLIWGASCLPKDEYEKWVGTTKARFSKPLGREYLKWAIKNKSKLKEKLKATTMDHPD